MCIRDRFKKGVLELIVLAAVEQKDMYGYEPVSYTHLDVYKRQVYKHIILNIYQKVNQNFLTSNSNGVIIVLDRVIKHARVNHTLE